MVDQFELLAKPFVRRIKSCEMARDASPKHCKGAIAFPLT